MPSLPPSDVRDIENVRQQITNLVVLDTATDTGTIKKLLVAKTKFSAVSDKLGYLYSVGVGAS